MVAGTAARSSSQPSDIRIDRDRQQQRFTARCGGKEELWGLRAPGLEVVLDELHTLTLLAVGGLKGASNTTDGHGDAPGSSFCDDALIPSVDVTLSLPPQVSPPPLPGAQDPSQSPLELKRGSRNGTRSGGQLCVSDVLPTGIVLCGPSGVGKTLVLDILSQDLRERHGVHVVRILGPQILAGFSHGGGGGGHGNRGPASAQGNFLSQALADARTRAPSVLIVDELDAIFDSMGGEGGALSLAEGARAGAALLSGLDSVSSSTGVAVVGATRCSPGGKKGAGWADLEGKGGGEGLSVPAAFRKPGRFDRCVEIGPPTQAGREGIVRVLLQSFGWELEPIGLTHFSASDTTRTREQADDRGHGHGANAASLPAARPSSLYTNVKNCRDAADRSGEHGKGGMVAETALERRHDRIGVITAWAQRLSSVTPGMVGGDLDRLVRTVRARATRRQRDVGVIGTTLSAASIDTMSSRRIVPASMRQNTLLWQDAMEAVAATVPRSLHGMDVASFSEGSSGGVGGGSGPTWASVGGFFEARRRLQRLVQWPWQHPEAFARMGISAPAGALLYGPSGCGKSLVAQVLANECLANFVWVRSSELLSRCAKETKHSVLSVRVLVPEATNGTYRTTCVSLLGLGISRRIVFSHRLCSWIMLLVPSYCVVSPRQLTTLQYELVFTLCSWSMQRSHRVAVSVKDKTVIFANATDDE